MLPFRDAINGCFRTTIPCNIVIHLSRVIVEQDICASIKLFLWGQENLQPVRIVTSIAARTFPPRNRRCPVSNANRLRPRAAHRSGLGAGLR